MLSCQVGVVGSSRVGAKSYALAFDSESNVQLGFFLLSTFAISDLFKSAMYNISSFILFLFS